MTDYNRKEKRAINDGFGVLGYCASLISREDDLDAALKYERKGRHSLDVARGIICQSALRGIEAELSGEMIAPHALHGISWGCRYAYLLGAELAYVASHHDGRELQPAGFSERIDVTLRRAADAFDGATRRRLAELNPDSAYFQERAGR